MPPYLPGRCTRLPVPCLPVPLSVLSTRYTCLRDTSVRGVEEERVPEARRGSLPPQNKPPLSQEPAHKGQETRYRESLLTREAKTFQPLKKCHQTPLKAGARYFTTLTLTQTPVPGRLISLFLIKSVKSSVKAGLKREEPGITLFYTFGQNGRNV